MNWPSASTPVTARPSAGWGESESRDDVISTLIVNVLKTRRFNIVHEANDEFTQQYQQALTIRPRHYSAENSDIMLLIENFTSILSAIYILDGTDFRARLLDHRL